MKLGKRLEIGLKRAVSSIFRMLGRTEPISPPETIRRVLFIRYGGIGDMILSLPVFRAARARHPQAMIDVLCDRKNAGPLLGTGLADRVFCYEKNPFKVTRLVLTLRRRRYDYIVNLVAYPSFTFGILAQQIGPRAVRVAGDQGEFAYFYNRLVDLPPKAEIHMLQRLFLLAADITGPKVSGTEVPWVVYPNEVRRVAGQLLAGVVRVLSPRPRLIAVNISAGLPRREWPLEKYAQFLRAAVGKYQDPLWRWAIISDPAKPGKARALAELLPPSTVEVLPPMGDFRVMMEFLRHCYVLITPDTSFSHAASAMGTPALNLMIGENVKTWAPIGVPHRIVASADPKNLAELPVEEVLKAFEELTTCLAATGGEK